MSRHQKKQQIKANPHISAKFSHQTFKRANKSFKEQNNHANKVILSKQQDQNWDNVFTKGLIYIPKTKQRSLISNHQSEPPLEKISAASQGMQTQNRTNAFQTVYYSSRLQPHKGSGKIGSFSYRIQNLQITPQNMHPHNKKQGKQSALNKVSNRNLRLQKSTINANINQQIKYRSTLAHQNTFKNQETLPQFNPKAWESIYNTKTKRNGQIIRNGETHNAAIHRRMASRGSCRNSISNEFEARDTNSAHIRPKKYPQNDRKIRKNLQQQSSQRHGNQKLTKQFKQKLYGQDKIEMILKNDPKNDHFTHYYVKSNPFLFSSEDQLRNQHHSPQKSTIALRGIRFKKRHDVEAPQKPQIKKPETQTNNVLLEKSSRLKAQNYNPQSEEKVIPQIQFTEKCKKGFDKHNDDNQIPTLSQLPCISFPEVPQSPEVNATDEEILEKAKELLKAFGLSIKGDEEGDLILKKYTNCIMFNLSKDRQTVIWHYSGKVYLGGWEQANKQEGQKNGLGMQLIPKKSYYKGQFLHGKKSGYGQLLLENGSIYVGQWLEGKKHGRGRFYDKERDFHYEGFWRDNFMDGYGFQKHSQNQYYLGTFLKSRKSGYGFELFKNGDCYKGEYKNGEFSGYGKYTWKNESSYSGHFDKGLRNGNGIWMSTGENYECYSGEYLNDKKHGYGKYVWNNGQAYQGNFLQDEKHGEGCHRYANGEKLNGIWEEGKLVSLIQKKPTKEETRENGAPKKQHSGFKGKARTPQEFPKASKIVFQVTEKAKKTNSEQIELL